jgi:hypothetical protein
LIIIMTTISDIFTIPTQVHQGDFVLHLTEGVTRPADTLSTYVVTPQLEVCFDQALGLIKSALESNTSKGAYLHGSFGSGKSHFMAVLTLLLQNNPDARSVPELAAVVAKHNAWTEGRRFLVVPYHLIGAASLESAVLGHYAEYIRALHPQAPTPGFYRAERLFDDARRLRAAMGDAAFFNQLGGHKQDDDDGWGKFGSGWDAASFEAALSAPPMANERSRLVGDLVDAYFESARSLASTEGEGFVSLDEGLSIMSKHAQALGYDAVVLFLDELILWLASHAADHTFLSREGQKVGKLVESMIAERPIPLVSFIARQRDLRELVGDYLPGAEQLGFADVLNWWEARFDEITLEDRNLPAIVEKRLLRPRSAAAAQDLQNAFEQTARVREEVMNTLLTRAGDRDMFRQVYPFSPALVQTLVAISSLLQRERTALKLMLQLLVNQRDVLQLGDIVPVGDLFDVIVEGDEPFTQAMRLNFDHAKRLYRQKLLPMLEQEHGVTVQDVNAGAVDAASAQRFRTDDRLLKTLILSALAPEIEALRALTPSRLAALNHGTIRSPIPGQESQIVLSKCRNWAAQVGEIKIADEGANPAISLHIVGVDTEGILANAQSFDSYGNRIQKARSLLYDQIGLEAEDRGLLPPRYDLLWRGTWRTCEILFRNVRELSLDSLRAQEGVWRMVIDFPFDREGHTPADDRAKLQEFEATGEASNCLVWLPSFLTPRGMEDLGRLVLLDHVLSGHNLNQYGSHLSQLEREQARTLLQNQRDQMRQRIRNTLLAAYGISSMHSDAIDTSHDLDQHFVSLHPALTLQPPVGATFKDALDHLFAQALAHQFPAHPRFDVEVKRGALRHVLEVLQQATQVPDGRVEVERSQRDEVRRIAVSLQLGDMGETHFVLRDEWKSRFLRKQAEEGMPSLTVRRLRAWMDQPEVMGLPRDIQNLVIMGFALQNNDAFSLHGGPVEPRLERLDDELELRDQPLPDVAVWQAATQRLAAILGLVASPLLNATNLATWVADTKRETAQLQPAVAQLCTALKTRLTLLDIEANDAPRMQTAQATLSLLSDIAEADEADVVDVVAGADVATSETAMGQSIKQASTLVTTLDNTPWELFEKMSQVAGEGAPQAQAIVAQVKDALTRDEHVVHLADALQAARSAAFDLLTKMMQESQPSTQTLDASPVVSPPPPIKKSDTSNTRRGIGVKEAQKLFDNIKKELASNPDLALDIDWRLYHKDETAP